MRFRAGEVALGERQTYSLEEGLCRDVWRPRCIFAEGTGIWDVYTGLIGPRPRPRPSDNLVASICSRRSVVT